jgi:hypothetical protein
MNLGTGGMAMREMSDDNPMGDDEELDMSDVGSDMDDMGDLEDEDLGDLEDEDLGDLEDEDLGDLQEVDLAVLRRVLEEVESGEKTAEEAYEECCGEGTGNVPGLETDLNDLESDLGDLESDVDDLESDEGLEDDRLGLEDDRLGLEDKSYSECMESVKRIANMLTEDPDVFTR